MRKASRSPGATASPAPRSWRAGCPPAFKNGLDPDAVEGAAADCPTTSPTSWSTTFARSRRASHRLVARRRSHPQRLRGRKLHRRARRRSQARTGRIPPRPARQDRRALLGRARPRRARRPAGASRCRQAAAAASPCNTRSAAICRRSPRSRCPRRRGPRQARASARSIAAWWSIPTRSKAQIEGGIIFGLTAAL